MTIPEILKQLEPYTGRFPMAAMRAAIEQREAITPELLRIVEAVADNPVEFAGRQDCMLHLFAVYLLAQFREKRAYPAIVKMFSAPARPRSIWWETRSPKGWAEFSLPCTTAIPPRCRAWSRAKR